MQERRGREKGGMGNQRVEPSLNGSEIQRTYGPHLAVRKSPPTVEVLLSHHWQKEKAISEPFQSLDFWTLEGGESRDFRGKGLESTDMERHLC